MMKNSCFIFLILLFSCQSNDYYTKVEKELASGVRKDSLFLGLNFGMTTKDFFTHCWDLNKQGVIRQGNQNNSVMYKLEDELLYPAELNFYPDFYQDRIYEMPAIFTYTNWAPWNQSVSVDSLHNRVVDLIEEWYGGDFMEVKHSVRGTAYVNVQGNRRISVFKKGDNAVMALFTDLTVEKEADAEKRNRASNE